MSDIYEYAFMVHDRLLCSLIMKKPQPHAKGAPGGGAVSKGGTTHVQSMTVTRGDVTL